MKEKEIRSVLVNMGKQIVKENKSLAKWIDQQRSLHKELPCELVPILSTDVTEGYRNKCEFTIGKVLDSYLPFVF